MLIVEMLLRLAFYPCHPKAHLGGNMAHGGPILVSMLSLWGSSWLIVGVVGAIMGSPLGHLARPWGPLGILGLLLGAF